MPPLTEWYLTYYLPYGDWFNMYLSVTGLGGLVNVWITDHNGATVYTTNSVGTGYLPTFYPPYSDNYTVWIYNAYLFNTLTVNFQDQVCYWGYSALEVRPTAMGLTTVAVPPR